MAEVDWNRVIQPTPRDRRQPAFPEPPKAQGVSTRVLGKAVLIRRMEKRVKLRR